MKDNIESAKDYTDWMVKTGGFARNKTLRDEFAGLAMQGIIFAAGDEGYRDALVAKHAYLMADAMLKERNK